MPRARVKFKPPRLEGPFKFSNDHPEGEFRILSAYPTGDGLLVLLEATVVDPAIMIHLFNDAPMIRACEVLHADEQTVLLQFWLPFIPPPYRAILLSGNLPQFPHLIQDGWMVCDLTTSHERLSQLQAEFEATPFSFEVVSVTQSIDSTDLLTNQQRRFMTEALEHGYYDTPRECSLTDLADKLGVSKATMSVVLHRAEEVVTKEFFAEPID